MRWIFVSLLLLNAVVFVVSWQRTSQGELDAQATTAVLDAASLVLLSEVKGTAALATEVEVPLKDTLTPSSDAAAELCTMIGPFSGLLRAEYFQEYLAELDIAAAVKQLEVPGEPGYWVYQSPLPSRKAALRRLQELQSKGIDTYLIPKGELENGISFGLFTQESGARQRLQQVLELGYEASIKKMNRGSDEIWVSLGAIEVDKIGEQRWLQLLSREEGLEMRQIFCPAVASE